MFCVGLILRANRAATGDGKVMISHGTLVCRSTEVENQSCESQAALRLDLGIVAVAHVVNTEQLTMSVPDPPDVREVPSKDGCVDVALEPSC